MARKPGARATRPGEPQSKGLGGSGAGAGQHGHSRAVCAGQVLSLGHRGCKVKRADLTPNPHAAV